MSHFPALTGLRAIAAYLVFIHHFNIFKEIPHTEFLARVADELYIGVSMFFVLSGFLIYTRYSSKFRMGKPYWGEYLRNRFARIYPMYFIITTITFLSYLYVGNGYSRGENLVLYFLNVTFLRGFFDSFKYTGVIQGWTLTVEMCFYLLAPIIIIFFSKSWKILFIPICFFFTGLIITFFGSKLDWFGLFSSFTFTMNFTILGRIFEFTMGMLIAQAFAVANPQRKSGYAFTLVGTLLLLLVLYALTVIKSTYNVQQAIFHPLGFFLNSFVLPCCVGLLIVGLVNEQNTVSKVFSSPVFDLLGKSSYCFYLIHLGIFYDMIVYLFPLERYLIPFVLLNLIAILMYKYAELPIHRRIKYFGSKRRLTISPLSHTP